MRKKPNWGRYPNVMAAALYYNRKRNRGGEPEPEPGTAIDGWTGVGNCNSWGAVTGWSGDINCGQPFSVFIMSKESQMVTFSGEYLEG